MLRFLQPTFPISHLHSAMKPSSQRLKPSKVIPIVSRYFPHKLKFLSTGSSYFAPKSRISSSNGGVVRKFSTRPGRGKLGVGSGFESKSLIDDEADLSDWVSGLSSKDFTKTKLVSDSDNDIDNGRNDDGFRKGSGRGRDREIEDDRDGKRRKDSSFERFKGSGERGRGGGRFGGQRDGGNDSRSRFEVDRSGGREMRGGGRGGMGRGGIRNGENGRREMGNGGVRRGENVGGREMGNGGVRRGENSGREMRGGRSNTGRGGMRSGERDSTGRGGMRSGERDNTRRKGVALSGDDDEDEDESEERKGFKSFKELLGSDEEEDEEDSESVDEEEDGDLINKESVLAWRENKDSERISPPSSPSGGESYLTKSRFDQFSISPATIKALKDVGYETMTVVQEATLPVILKGKDVLAKARTGTGKTVAFLLPSIEVVEKTPAASRDEKRPPIIVLVMCPTRELACQAAAEANKLLKYHPSLGVQVVIGGTRLSLEQKRMQANPCQILVATPGRLKDHIENTAGFATRLSGIKVLVLDEADHLLDMGFRKDIERIIAAVPKQRQTLLFSATIPPEVRQICHIALKRDHEYINTVIEGSEETHTQVQQTHLVATLDNHFPLLYTLLKDHMADNVDYKVLVFCTTAMVTRLVAELLGELNLNVREIHSRKSQSYRTKVSDEFRKSKGLILVTSDVSARGVDYPDVSLVVQIGVPADRQQYIHRLGRTGRTGKEGQGVLLLAPWEEYFLSTVKDLPITKAPIPLVDPESKKKVERSLSRVGMKEKESAYQAWLGYYNSNKKIGKDKCRLVELANEFSRTMGLDNPPAIPKMILGKMGLKNIPGLRFK